MEITNTVRQRVWKQQPKGFLSEALIDTDGTIGPTLRECKGGMALSYKGIWGYAPLVVTLANTGEVLYLVNRPGNVVSHEGCVPGIDRAIQLLAGFPLTLELAGTNLPKRSRVKISQIRTLSVKRLGKKLGRISVEELDQVIEGLNEIIGS
jgi:mRNA-degrading endonuclease toxin of MazEF toxin-antitoxin module